VLSRGRDALLGPIPNLPGPPARNTGIADLITTYLRLLGPATPVEVARYLGSATTELTKVWPDDLAEVSVDGRRAWLPNAAVEELRGAEAVRGVRLIPPMDALLQARDRDLLVPH